MMPQEPRSRMRNGTVLQGGRQGDDEKEKKEAIPYVAVGPRHVGRRERHKSSPPLINAPFHACYGAAGDGDCLDEDDNNERELFCQHLQR